MLPFTHTTNPARVVFGRGSLAQVGDELERLGASRALVLSTPGHRSAGAAMAGQLGTVAVGTFAGAVQHIPVEVTEQALKALSDNGADSVVAIGGGSTIRLGKALAARAGVHQVAVPTTYAGSEVTPILGETKGGVKTTRRGPEFLPDVVVYDPDLTDSLPLPLAVTSGLNAMAHAAEGVYSRDGSPVYTSLAVEGLRAFQQALPALQRDPADRDARDEALCGAWLCGTVLGGVGMSIHHKLCHVLGGALDLPHAETHAVLLPHAIGFVEQAVPEAVAPVAEVFGGRAGRGLQEFALALGAPARLADLGVAEGDLDRLADLATVEPYWSPRPVDRAAVRALLQEAWAGDPVQ